MRRAKKTPDSMRLQWPAGTTFVSNPFRKISSSAVTAFGADVASRPSTVQRILEVNFFLSDLSNHTMTGAVEPLR